MKLTLQWQLKFITMIIFTLLLFLLKITVGHLSNSMALVADSFHMMTDFAALTIGYLALTYSKERTRDSSGKNRLDQHLHKFTFGWIRVEVLGGLINTVFLFALCFAVFVASLRRLVLPKQISNPKPVLIVGCVSLCVNFLGLFLFRTNRGDVCSSCCMGTSSKKKKKKPIEKKNLLQHEDDDEEDCSSTPQSRPCRDVYHHHANRTHAPHHTTTKDSHHTPHTLNVRSVFLHILEHFLASFVVISTAMVSLYFGGEEWVAYIDPTFTIVLVVLILYLSLPLFRETVRLFMQTAPGSMDLQQVREGLRTKVPEVVGVHEFHVWHLGADQVVASAHVLFHEYKTYERQCEAVKTYFHDQGISCMTLQPEFLNHNHNHHNNHNNHNHNQHDHDHEEGEEMKDLASLGNTCFFKCVDCAPPNSCCVEEVSTA